MPETTSHLQELANAIVDQEVLSAKAKRHRYGSEADFADFAALLAKTAPPGMSVHALEWCYSKHRISTGAKMTPSALHSLYRQYRRRTVTPSDPQASQKPQAGRYGSVIYFRLMRALGLQGNGSAVPLMPGDEDLLNREPSRAEADEFFATCERQVIDSWRQRHNFPYRDFSPPAAAASSDDTFGTEGWL